jgi:hypothetical protein
MYSAETEETSGFTTLREEAFSNLLMWACSVSKRLLPVRATAAMVKSSVCAAALSKSGP